MSREAQISPNSSVGTSNNIKLSEQRPKCVKCNSVKVRKKGFRKTSQRGHQQRWICNVCKTSFTLDNGFWKMKNNEQKVCQAIDTYYEGLSLRKVRRNFYKYANTQISHQSVLNWIRKYVYLIRNYLGTLNPNLSLNYYSDETIIKCAGENHNFGVVMDANNRYVIATNYVEDEYITSLDTSRLWETANDIKRPKRLRTDNHSTYKEAFNKVFYTRYNKDKVEWTVVNSSKTGKFNYLMERLFNNLKERIKIMRGFKASWSAKLLLDGYFVWYNFIRPHMTFKATPSEKVGLKFNGLLELINLAVT